LTTSQVPQYATSIAPDGKTLVGYEIAAGSPDLVVFHLDTPAGQRHSEPLVKTSFIEVLPELSPDGKYIAYFSNESGGLDVYVRPFPNVEAGRWQITTNGGGTRPVWARNGRELFFLDRNSALSSVPVDTHGATFTFGNPTKLLEPRYFSLPGPRPFDVSADGQRFLMIKDMASPTD